MIHRYSTLDTAQRCLRKFKLQYVDQVPTGGIPSIDLEFGTAMHSALQASLEGDNATEAFRVYWESVRSPFTPSNANRLQSIAGEFIRKFEKMHLKHFAPGALIEREMNCKIKGLDFSGTADYIGGYQGRHTVLDFKTSYAAYTREKILSNPQMPLYAIMSEALGGPRVEQIVYLVFVKSTGSIQTVIEPLTEAMRERAMETCLLMAQDLETRNTWPTNYNSCKIGSSVCPYFKTCWETKE